MTKKKAKGHPYKVGESFKVTHTPHPLAHIINTVATVRWSDNVQIEFRMENGAQLGLSLSEIESGTFTFKKLKLSHAKY